MSKLIAGAQREKHEMKTVYVDLDEIEARASEALPGPWQRNGVRSIVREDSIVITGGDGQAYFFAPIGRTGADHAAAIRDAKFIAAARADVPALVAEVRRLRGLVANVAALPEKIRALPDGKHMQDYAALIIEEAIDADIQNGFTREVREAVQ